MATLSEIIDEVSIGKKKPNSTPPTQENIVWIKDCAYQRVVVYQDRAEVIREVEVAVREGDNELTLVGLPQVADKDSIRVEVETTEVRITDVVYIDQFEVEIVTEEGNVEEIVESGKATGEREDLRATMKELNKEKALVEKRIEVVRRVNKILERFGSMLGKGRTSEMKKEQGQQVLPNFNELTNGERLNTVVGFSEAYLKRVDRYSAQMKQLQEQSTALKEKITVLEMNLRKRGETSATKSAKSNTSFQKAVKINLESVGSTSNTNNSSPQSVRLSVSYLVSNASWEPLYHLRVSFPENNEPNVKPLLQIHYFGLIKQSSGEDWKATKISLSTASPSKGGEPPTLQPNNLRVNYQSLVLQNQSSKRGVVTIPTIGFASEEFSANIQTLQNRSLNFAPQMQEVEEQKVTLHSTQFIQRFDTARPATIPSDATEHKVGVTVIDLQPVLEHVCVPEKSEHCFLTARVDNESEYPLLAGSSSVFLNNNFIAKSKVDNVAPGEELVVSLGADPEVRIKYKPGEAVTNLQEGWISTSKQLAYNTLTTINNGKRDPISLILRISLPVSQEKKVTVNLKQPPCNQAGKKIRVEGGTAEITSKNHVEWKICIKPGVKHRVYMLYDVNT